jgi:hypothetical protein
METQIILPMLLQRFKLATTSKAPAWRLTA